MTLKTKLSLRALKGRGNPDNKISSLKIRIYQNSGSPRSAREDIWGYFIC